MRVPCLHCFISRVFCSWISAHREELVPNDLAFINWTAAPLSPEQQLVLRHLAVLFLRKKDLRTDHVDFTHELIEGRLYRKSKGVFVTLAGTFFHADMGEVNGVRWTSDFLVPAGTENIPFNDEVFRTMFRRMAYGADVFAVDEPLTRVTADSLLL